MPASSRPSLSALTVATRSSGGEAAGWRISTISWSAMSLRARWMMPVPMSSRLMPSVTPSETVEAPIPAKVSQLSPTSKAK
jgi:hypothetical protein